MSPTRMRRKAYFILAERACLAPDGCELKIALVHYTYTPVIGGVEIIMAEHARLFTEQGHEVTVYCDQGSSDDPRIRVELLPDANDAAEMRLALEPDLARQDVIIMH